ncbi:MAG: hypothetical protein ACTSP3_14655 [Candidatus Heimdallarchaeaceae archaeon]
MSLTKKDMLNDSYFYEFPLIELESPRPLEAYSMMIESTTQDFGFDIKSHSKSEISWGNKRVIPFKCAIKASSHKTVLTSKIGAYAGFLIFLAVGILASGIALMVMAVDYVWGSFVGFSFAFLFASLPISIYLTKKYKSRQNKVRLILLWIIFSFSIIADVVFTVFLFMFGYMYLEEIFYFPMFMMIFGIYTIIDLVRTSKKTSVGKKSSNTSINLKLRYEGLIYQKIDFAALTAKQFNAINPSIESMDKPIKIKDTRTLELQSTPQFLHDYEKIEMKIMFSIKFPQDYNENEAKEFVEQMKETLYFILATKPITLNYEDTMEYPKETELELKKDKPSRKRELQKSFSVSTDTKNMIRFKKSK